MITNLSCGYCTAMIVSILVPSRGRNDRVNAV
jgi:hypothetical protein